MKINIILILSAFCLTLSFAQNNTVDSYIDTTNELLDKKDYKRAIETINFAIHKMPDSLRLYDMRGTLLETFRLYDDAIKDFTTAIKKTKDPKFKSHLYANRGGTKFRIRDYDGSYTDLKKAIKFDPNNLDALNNLAAVCDEVNKPEETLKYLIQIIKIDPNYVPAYVNIGFKYQAMDKHKLAIKYFNKAIKFAPNEGLAYSNRSFSKLKTNDNIGAMEDINYSIKLYPTNSYAYKIKALILIENNNMKEACENLEQANKLGYTDQYGNEVNELKEKHCK